MNNEELIEGYTNQLARAAVELRRQFDRDLIELPLDDRSGRILSLRFWSARSRISGRLTCPGQPDLVVFELKLRPRFIEFSHPKAGPMGTLRVAVTPHQVPQQQRALVSEIATLATRLQHFSIFKRVRLGIRQSSRPPALSA